MAALGDSLTVAFDSAGNPVDNPSASWSTGDDPAVNSHYERLLALDPSFDFAYNHAVSGSKMAATYAHAGYAVSEGVGYVTIFSGTNDVCTPTVGQMTSVTDFSAQLRNTLTRLTEGLPSARILVVSIPDWYGHWKRYRHDPAAVQAWVTYPDRCPTLLGPAAIDATRQAVSERIGALNSAIAAVCAEFPACTSDGGVAFRLPFTKADLAFKKEPGDFDYFHLSIQGQARLAEATWRVGPFAPPYG